MRRINLNDEEITSNLFGYFEWVVVEIADNFDAKLTTRMHYSEQISIKIRFEIYHVKVP
jgi:hypothetical protein